MIRGWKSLWMVLVGIILIGPPALVRAAEIIQIRTGQVGGVPGSCPGLDDSFTYDPVNMTPCSLPFRAAPFTSTDFTDAAAGPQAQVITPWGVYLPALGSDPLARWINWQATPNCFGGTPASVLYAYRFVVKTGCNPMADVRVCWAVDDWLGDPVGNGPNNVGIYINGVPLNPGFSGGNYAAETCSVQGSVPLNTGVNYLYVYQRDGACATSGIVLSARLSVNSTTCPSISVFKFNDLNGNGVQDGSEPALAGWQVNISGPVNLSGVTNVNGVYTFPCLPVGTYVVSETNQPGWVQTAPPGGLAYLTIDCGQDYAVTFGNKQCEQGQAPCVPLPSCLSGWFPFDDCSGTTANEVVANRDGMIVGGSSNPTWGTGRWGSPCGLNIPGAPGTQSVIVPNCPEHNFGTGSFTIFAWVRTNLNDSVVHTILDKRVLPFMTPTGYSLYLYNGLLRFQYGDGTSGFTTLASTAPPLGDGAWHTVAVSICRNPANPSQNVASLYVDNYVDTFTGAYVVTGSLTNTAALTMGDQCPGFLVGRALAGSIDDLLLFKCCLNANQIASLRTDYAYCYETCYVPSIKNAPFATTSTTLTLCNYSLTPQTYNWSIAGLPAGTGCSLNGPTVFSPPSGTVTIPAATSGPACVSIPIGIQVPGGMFPGQTACYAVTTLNTVTGKCCLTRGRIRKTKVIHVVSDPAEISLPVDTTTPLSFKVYNDSTSAMDFAYQIVGASSDGDPDNQVVRLNGLPPGIPVTGTLSIAPQDSAVITIDVALDQFQPLNPNEVILEGDLDGDGTLDSICCATLFSVSEVDAANVPGKPGESAGALPVTRLLAAPNPFRGSTGIQLSLAGAQKDVRIEVFNAGGQLVRGIFAGPLPAGTRSFTWDGRDEQGSPAGSGIFFLRARSPEVLATTKLIRIK